MDKINGFLDFLSCTAVHLRNTFQIPTLFVFGLMWRVRMNEFVIPSGCPPYLIASELRSICEVFTILR
ncbi:hypothetical protein RB195_016284 [Necator americanus]|uniref:Uncharacterized protein n=1 Tax=Necator americanus TaxID=51031 RepID=A0ABR1E8P1_NECAM